MRAIISANRMVRFSDVVLFYRWYWDSSYRYNVLIRPCCQHLLPWTPVQARWCYTCRHRRHQDWHSWYLAPQCLAKLRNWIPMLCTRIHSRAIQKADEPVMEFTAVLILDSCFFFVCILPKKAKGTIPVVPCPGSDHPRGYSHHRWYVGIRSE